MNGKKIFGSPAIAEDGTIYIGTTDLGLLTHSRFYAINPDGTEKWYWTPPCYSCSCLVDYIDSTPAIASDGTIYVGCWNRRLYALYPNGTLKWEFYDSPWKKCCGFVLTSPAIAPDGTIYIGNNNGILYAINSDGSLKWRYTTGGYITSSPAIDADGTVYVGSGDGYVYAINPDGSLMWKYNTGKIWYSSAALSSDGTLYIGETCGGKLYAFDVNYPPVLHSIGSKTVDEGIALNITITASDPDGDMLTFSNNASFGTFTPINSTASLWHWTPDYDDAGVYYAEFSVYDDNGGIDNETVMITVTDVNRVPELEPIGVGHWITDYDDAGIYSVDFGVSDGKAGIDNETVKITVHNKNRPPELVPITDIELNETETLTIDVNATDPDGGSLAYSAFNLPHGATFNSSTRIFSWTPSSGQAGIYSDVHFEASDGELIDFENITITVKGGVVEISVEPKNINVQPQGEFDVNITLDSIGNSVYAVQYCLHYNTSVVRAETQAKRSFLGNSGETIIVINRYQSTAIPCSCSHDPDYPGRGGNISYIRWAFGDGQYGTSEGFLPNCSCVEHKYESWQWEDGHYVPFIATLTVTDDGYPELSNSTSWDVKVYIAGDANGDGEVNVLDMVWVGKHWRRECSTRNPCASCTAYLWDDSQADGADLNNDCEINVLDVVIIGANWRHSAW